MSELIYYRNLDEQLLVFPIKGTPTGIELKYVKSISLITELIPIPRSPRYILGIVNIDSNIYPVIDLDVLLTGRMSQLHNPIISLIDIGETTFGVHTHNLPQVIPGTAEDTDGSSEQIPEEWILGYTDHPKLGQLPIIDPKKFWIGMGESEVIGPSLEMEVTPQDIYQDDPNQEYLEPEEFVEPEVDERKAALQEAEEMAKEIEKDAALKEAEEMAMEVEKDAVIQEAEAMAAEVETEATTIGIDDIEVETSLDPEEMEKEAEKAAIKEAEEKAKEAEKEAEKEAALIEAEQMAAVVEQEAMLEESGTDLTEVNGIGPKVKEELIKIGIETAEQLADASVKTLTQLDGVGKKTAQTYISNAREFLGLSEEED